MGPGPAAVVAGTPGEVGQRQVTEVTSRETDKSLTESQHATVQLQPAVLAAGPGTAGPPSDSVTAARGQAQV